MHEIGDLAGLIEALRWSERENVRGTVHGTIAVSEGLPVVNGTHDISLEGLEGVRPALDFDQCRNDGWPVRCKRLELSGLRFTNYEGWGQCIDLQQCESATIDRCVFSDIGRIVWPPLRLPVTNAHDTIYVQAVGGWNTAMDVRITRCLFEDVSGGQVRWSHAVYVTGKSVLVQGCRFSRCGGAVALAAEGDGPEFIGNRWEEAVRGNESYERWEYPDFWYGGGKPARVRNNTIVGPVRWVWGGRCEQVKQIDNDWTQARPTLGVWWPNREAR